jgi:hypothetical protein
MATDQITQTVTVIAGADLSALQYRFVEADGTLPAGAGADAMGVNYSKVTSGRPATVVVAGVAKVVAGAAVAVKDKIQTDANGKAIPATTGDHVLGMALTAAGADGEVIEVLLGGGCHPIIA